MTPAAAAQAGRAAFGATGTPTPTPPAGNLARAGQWLRGSGVGPGMARSVGTGIAANFAANAINSQIPESDSVWDDVARGFTTGAATGAGFGAFLGPKGAAIGALGAGAFGAITGLLGDSRSSETQALDTRATNQQRFNEMMDTYGISPENRQLLGVQLESLLFNATTPEQVEAAYAQAASVLPQVFQEQQVTAQRQQAEAARAAALQSMLAPMLQRQSANSNLYAAQLQATMREAAGSIQNEALRNSYLTSADMIPLQNAQSNMAQLTQMQLADAAFRAAGDQQYENDLRMLQQQSVMGNTAYSGANGVDELLQTLLAS